MKNAEILDLPDDAIRQHIDARQTFIALQQAKTRMLAYRGGMLWREVNGVEYLVRTTNKGAQTGLGARSEQTEAIYKKFMQGKQQQEQSVANLKVSLERHQRLNRALRVGRTPNVIIDVLSEIDRSGMSEHFTVIGTNALYAYETAASARVEEKVLATNDLDLLWDNRKKLSVAVQGKLSIDGMIGLLRKVDPSFTINQSQLYTAVNGDGYEVDLIRIKEREYKSPDAKNNPIRLSQNDDDFWVVQARNADWLLSAPKFKEIVVGTNGKMAYMNTVDPRAFVLFKLWMAMQKDRDYGKRLRDVTQAEVVTQIINERLPQLAFEDIKIFPTSVTDMLVEDKKLLGV